MVELKRHAQALCLLITTLGAHDEAIGNQNREGRPGEVLNVSSLCSVLLGWILGLNTFSESFDEEIYFKVAYQSEAMMLTLTLDSTVSIHSFSPTSSHPTQTTPLKRIPLYALYATPLPSTMTGPVVPKAASQAVPPSLTIRVMRTLGDSYSMRTKC